MLLLQFLESRWMSEYSHKFIYDKMKFYLENYLIFGHPIKSVMEIVSISLSPPPLFGSFGAPAVTIAESVRTQSCAFYFSFLPPAAACSSIATDIYEISQNLIGEN